MLPVTRANLDHICCVCLLDIRPSRFTQKVYDIKEEKNISKILKLTAHITILKNPINQKYIYDYCRKICEICFVKTQYSFFFREKILASTATLKELLESNDLSNEDTERLQYFCRICLNRQKPKDVNNLKMLHLNWLKNCSGIRYTSIIDTEAFRIKEGTNINEIATINDAQFPRQLCQICLKKLQNVEEFRQLATQSFEYMISVMGEASVPDDELVSQEVKQFKKNIVWNKLPEALPIFFGVNNLKQDDATTEFDKYDETLLDFNSPETLHYQTDDNCNGLAPGVNTSDYLITSKLGDNSFEDAMGLIEDDLHNYSDNERDADFTINFNDDDTGDESDNNSKKNECLRKTRAKNSKKCNLNDEANFSCKDENIEIADTSKRKIKRKKIEKQLDESNKIATNRKKRSRKNEKSKDGDKLSTADNTENKTNELLVCAKCLHTFATKSTLKRHERTVHAPVSKQKLHECLMCSKEFKRLSHLTDHIKSVHEKLRPFQCTHCKKMFASNSSKRAHELTHTGNLPFVCECCDRRFRRSSELKIHLELHTTNPELLCPICKRIQKTQEDLENHIKNHDDNRLQCPSCGKLFRRSSHLKDHYNAVHLKLRPFKCQYCELAFGDRKTRRKHEESHINELPITCGVCKMGFKSNFSLSRHINKFGHKTEDNNVKKDATKKQKSARSKNLQLTGEVHSLFEL